MPVHHFTSLWSFFTSKNRCNAWLWSLFLKFGSAIYILHHLIPTVLPMNHTSKLTNFTLPGLHFNLGKIVMHTTEGRHLFSARYPYLIIEQIWTTGMGQHKKRYCASDWYFIITWFYVSSSWSLFIFLLGQIKMSNQTEVRVEDLLSRSKWNTNNSASTSTVSMRQFLPSASSSVVEPAAPIDKEKLSSQLRDLQNSRKVLPVTMDPLRFHPLKTSVSILQGSHHLYFISDDSKC